MTMREILFRGKRVKPVALVSQWILGNYVFKADDSLPGLGKHFIVVHDGFGLSQWVEVDPDTIGQYTGLTDKNGKKIFEGDILSAHFDFNNPDVESRTVVEWGNFKWVTHQPGYEPDDITDFDKGLWTVIGNVHDNPELIGGEHHG